MVLEVPWVAVPPIAGAPAMTTPGGGTRPSTPIKAQQEWLQKHVGEIEGEEDGDLDDVDEEAIPPKRTSAFGRAATAPVAAVSYAKSSSTS